MDKIICVGKNYLEHALELGDAIPDYPVLFLKPPSVLVQASQGCGPLELRLPREKGEVHFESEIVVKLGANLEIEALTLGLDMTLRGLQGQLKKQGHPWEVSKVFRDSAVIGPWISFSEFEDYLEEEFLFTLDGSIRQRARGRQMTILPQFCLDYAKSCFPLCPGDLIFTGTPAGVGKVTPGQVGELRWGSRLHYEMKF